MKVAYRERQGFRKRGTMTSEEIHIISITDDSFEGEVLKSPVPVLVVFGSESSGSAYITLRQIKEVAREYEGRVKVGKVEAADNVLTTRQFRIRQIPTLLFFKNGLVVDSVAGTVRKREVRSGIRGLLNE
jgi:thioredoxin 1